MNIQDRGHDMKVKRTSRSVICVLGVVGWGVLYRSKSIHIALQQEGRDYVCGKEKQRWPENKGSMVWNKMVAEPDPAEPLEAVLRITVFILKAVGGLKQFNEVWEQIWRAGRAGQWQNRRVESVKRPLQKSKQETTVAGSRWWWWRLKRKGQIWDLGGGQTDRVCWQI